MRHTLLLAVALMGAAACSHTDDGAFSETIVFHNLQDGIPYRIPAIALNEDGVLIAAGDYRYCREDIGGGPIDLHYAISRDNGSSWGEPAILAAGDSTLTGNDWRYAYGDLSLVVCDGKEGIGLSVGGHVGFFQATAQNPQQVVLHRSSDGGLTWPSHKCITDRIYPLFDARPEGPAQGIFMTSGRILCSRSIRTQGRSRIYCACPVRPGGAYVLYSDDWGESWAVLGGAATAPSTSVDEAKVEELPDGGVLLSVRRQGGRSFNVFRYDDPTQGSGTWGTEVSAPAMEGVNACNGGILLTRAVRTADNKKVWLLLQSLPFGPGRVNVGVFYAELPDGTPDAGAIASAWKKGYCLSPETGAYSEMISLPNRKVGIFYERSGADGGYDLVFSRADISVLTLGEYRTL